ncbi:MAG TPA: GNAT family N-acetyltransferase [Acidimicrobiales bacterium]|nr:GNAT family N-acetyltransferase [Acidimicrobiales bacterium]
MDHVTRLAGTIPAVQVRLAGAGDVEAIRRIYNAEVTRSTVTFDLVPRTARSQRAWVGRHQGAHPALVAVEGGEVCGFGSLSPFRDRAAYATTVEDSVYVDEAWRGQGVGRMLLEELVGVAARQGFHTVIARTTADNAPSIALHVGCGFALVGVEREVGRKFGRWLDVAVLQKML